MCSQASGDNIHNRGRSWIDMPQSNSLSTDIFIFLAGGMNLAISLGWSFNYYNLQYRYSWFIGVAIGAILAAPLLHWQPKRKIMIFARFLVLICGIIAVSASDNLDAVLAANYLNGIGVGITTVCFIIHASEISSEHHRGFCLAFEQVGLACGAYVQMLYTACWSVDMQFSPNCLYGIFCIIFALISIGLSYFSIESPIFYLRKADEPEALSSIVRLYRPTIVNNDKQALLVELKEYVEASERLSWLESFRRGLGPLLKLLCYRAMLAFINALPLSIAVELTALLAANASINWPPIVYGYASVLGTLIAMGTSGSIGRKPISLISLLLTSMLTIGACIVFSFPDCLNSHPLVSVACTLLIIAQLFGNVYAPSSTVYLGEAFPLRWKPSFIALCVIVQYMIDLVIVCTFVFTTSNMYMYCLVTGIIMFCGFWLFCFTMPETKRLKLWEAEQKISNWLNLGCH